MNPIAHFAGMALWWFHFWFSPQILTPIIGPVTSSSVALSHINNGVGNEGVSSPNFTVLAGDTIVGFCRSGGGATTLTVTDSGGINTVNYVSATQTDVNVGNTRMWYIQNAAANASENWLCVKTGAVTESALVVQFRGGLTSSILDANLQNTAGGSPTSQTTGTFSTGTANEAIFFCVATGVNATYTAGLIGGVTATLGPTLPGATDNMACEYLIVTTTQSSITAAMSWNTGGGTNWGLGTFK
jgi:hypothetical protein